MRHNQLGWYLVEDKFDNGIRAHFRNATYHHLLLYTGLVRRCTAAQPNTAHVASGTLSGTITCPNGDASSATIVFGVTQYHDYSDITGTEGNWRIGSQPVGSFQGVLTDGHVGKKSFRATGSETISGCNTILRLIWLFLATVEQMWLYYTWQKTKWLEDSLET